MGVLKGIQTNTQEKNTDDREVVYFCATLKKLLIPAWPLPDLAGAFAFGAAVLALDSFAEAFGAEGLLSFFDILGALEGALEPPLSSSSFSLEVDAFLDAALGFVLGFFSSGSSASPSTDSQSL